jgi:hypothetical protein
LTAKVFRQRPALASLEKQGLVRHHVVDQHAVRPNKKVYELTEEGRAALRRWVESPTVRVLFSDEFFLKAYSLWLADPDRMAERFREQARLHQEQLAHFEQAARSKQLVIVRSNDPGVVKLVTHPLWSRLASIIAADLSTRGPRRANLLAVVCG